MKNLLLKKRPLRNATEIYVSTPQKKKKTLQSRLEKLESQLQLASKKELVLPKSAEEVEAWSRQHPDVASIVESIADKESYRKI